MQELLHLMQFENDETAFKEFYQQNVFRLFQFAFAFLRNKEISEEIANDVFLKLWQHRLRLGEIRNINVYMYVSVKNAALNYLRRQGGKRNIEIGELSADHFGFSPDQEQIMITNELKKKIEDSINQLPPKCKIIFKLLKEDGLTSNEVASVLSISHKTVNAQLSIALKKLELFLNPSLKELEYRL